MSQETRARAVLISVIIVSGCAVTDVLTGWALLSLPPVIACLAAGMAGILIGARRLRLAFLALSIICLSLHLGYSLFIGYEAGNWDRLEGQKADRALSKVQASIDRRFSSAELSAATISRDRVLGESLLSGSEREVFSFLARAAGRLGLRSHDRGLVVTDAKGNPLAWAGRIPDFGSGLPSDAMAAGIDLRQSTTHHWIESRARISSGEETLGWVRLFERLDAIYPNLLRGIGARTLDEELTRHVGHDVTVLLGPEHSDHATETTAESLTGEIRLPDGRVVGQVSVTARVFDAEKRSLERQGLFAASISLLALIVTGTAALSRQVVRARFKQASARNLFLLLTVIGAARIGFSLLRDSLRLGDLPAFTSYGYATRIPTGILRSPADLLITCAVVGLGLSLLILARARRTRPGEQAPSATGYDTLPTLILSFVVGAIASGVVFLSDHVLRRVFDDSAIVIFTLSPFDVQPSHLVMRLGLLTLSISIILLGAILISWQMSLLRRHWSSDRDRMRPVVIAALTLYGLAAIFIITGLDWVVLVTATLAFGLAHVLDMAFRRKVAIGLMGLAVGFGLAASALEFPYALQDYHAERRESIETVSTQVMARNDAWKISVLDEALARVARDAEIRDMLEQNDGNLDAFALKLWANSILGRANVISGIHILNAGHQEMGRFSLQDVGDLAEVDAALREARFRGRPLTTLVRSALGGRELEVYVGVAPFFRQEDYVGSAVVTIPFAYRDVESMAGTGPTFFGAMDRSGALRSPSGETYSASMISDGRIVSTTAAAFEVGKEVVELGQMAPDEPGWLEHTVGGTAHASYFAPYPETSEALLLSYRLPPLSEKGVRLMGITVGNILIAFLVILIWSMARAMRYGIKRLRGMPRARLRWGFASKLALAFVLIAIVPTLILGTASSRFLQARLREIMESKAAESLNLSMLALDRLVFAEAFRLAHNPILFDALAAEPSLLGQLVTQDLEVLSYDVSSAVIDSRGDTLAAFGNPDIPPPVLESVLDEGRTYGFFSADRALTAKAAVPVRDEINPERIIGCAFVSRRLDDALARQISTGLGRDLSFFAGSHVTASSRQELFVSELMASTISPDAFVECVIGGKEQHFTWERVGNLDVVVGYSPVRASDGRAVGALSVPVVFRKDDVGRRMEWTSSAISYLLVIVMCAIFVFGLLLARRISRPIRELIRGTMRIGSGDLAFTIPKSGDDEIGDLVSSFNTMTVALAKSRKTLSERKRYIETIIGNVGAGIISTNARGRIDTFNSAAERMLGLKARHARGRDAHRLLRRTGAAGLAAVLDTVKGDSRMVRKEVALTHKDGRAVTLRAVATDVSGPRARSMGKVIVFEDVTELIRSKKLIAWSEMARQVAHEIKNPLTPMKLSAQHLLQARKDGATDFDQVLQDSVATIVEQIESLRRIAVEFSQFSRMPERKPERADINKILEDSIGQYERTVAGSIEIGKDLDAAIPSIQIDRDELGRVFLNIIENAVQAMPDGGRLEIRSVRARPGRYRSDYNIRVSSRGGYGEEPRSFVEVSFTDSGTGISADNAAKLFEPNFSTKSHGTGLGLAICKGIMDAYGGEMVIESTQGVGTCVRVRLPLPERPPTRRPPSRRPPRRRATGRRHPPRRR